MNILVINCGSSSLGFKVYQPQPNGQANVIASGKARNVATHTQANSSIEWKILDVEGRKAIQLNSHRDAANEVLTILADQLIHIDAAGHRFVHGGEHFTATARIDTEVIARLQQCLPLAPIHNPNSYSVIEVCLERIPDASQFAVFDTAFHASMPADSIEYAIPRRLAQEYGLRKYGFHGLSYQYVSRKTAELLHQPLDQVKLIMCHLGTGGSSVCAFEHGHSIETSMGFSPLAGLVMSTRCGDIDPEIVLELARRGLSTSEIEDILNDRSGLLGLSGYSSNLAEIIDAAEAGDENCQLAFEVYANRLKFYLGAFTWRLNGADAVVFTDDIGVKSWKLREKVCSQAENLGVRIDQDANRKAVAGTGELISTPDSHTRVMVVATDEESVIFSEVMKQIEPTG